MTAMNLPNIILRSSICQWRLCPCSCVNSMQWEWAVATRAVVKESCTHCCEAGPAWRGAEPRCAGPAGPAEWAAGRAS
jgi:hypothetical protein